MEDYIILFSLLRRETKYLESCVRRTGQQEKITKIDARRFFCSFSYNNNALKFSLKHRVQSNMG